jgi:hypothetical protein
MNCRISGDNVVSLIVVSRAALTDSWKSLEYCRDCVRALRKELSLGLE